MSERGYVTTANARVEYHRNGMGGEGYYTIAFDSPDADPPILEVGQRMMAIVPSSAIHDEEGYLIMTILHEDARNRWPHDYAVGGRHYGILPPLPMSEEQMAEALSAYGLGE